MLVNYQGTIFSKNPKAEMRTKTTENLFNVFVTENFPDPGNSQAYV